MNIHTDRLIIRDFTEDDIDLIFDINNDPDCIKFNGWDSMTLEKCKENLQKWIDDYSKTNKLGAFCVVSKEDNIKIGMAFIIEYNEENHYEIGFRLRKSQWGKGYAKEITNRFIEYGREINAKVIIGEVYKENIKSRNIFEKIGFDKYPYPNSDDGLIYKKNIE